MGSYGKYVRISKVPRNFPFSKATLYLWAKTGKFPRLFKRVGKTLFIDMEEFDRLFIDVEPIKKITDGGNS